MACKYADFIGANVAALVGTGFTPFGFILPLGISFFTFQKISYLGDLRRGDRHFYGLLEFFAFVTFFPQLIAGPIVRHNELMPQWQRDPHGPALWDNLSRGFVLFTIGFAKKAGIADTLAPIVDPLFAQSLTGSLGLAQGGSRRWAMRCRSISTSPAIPTMAIGLGSMFGLRLPGNFDAPYRSCSIRETWRRWHITLSRFLRDYVYIPLGGSRAGATVQARNVVATMLLGGAVARGGLELRRLGWPAGRGAGDQWGLVAARPADAGGGGAGHSRRCSSSPHSCSSGPRRSPRPCGCWPEWRVSRAQGVCG